MPEVDLVVNSFERTYRQVLVPGFFPSIEEQNRRRFTRRVALVNNVDDLADARRRADDLVARGEVDEYHLVADHIDRALTACGLTRADLGRIPHYSDYLLVAVTLAGAPWVLHWDAEVTLRRGCDWVGPSLRLMEAREHVLLANPTSWKGEVRWTTEEICEGFALTYSCSDSVFLARRRDLARPIYGYRCPASLRHALSHIAAVWEQRVDSYLRATHRFRASFLGAVYEHPEEGLTYPGTTAGERVRKTLYYALIRTFAYLRLRHPSVTTWGARRYRDAPEVLAALRRDASDGGGQ